MGVQTEIDRIIGLVNDSHEKARAKGGTTTTPLLASLPGVIESIPQGVELPELGDKAAQPTDIVSGKVLYNDQGNPITGTMKALGFGGICNIDNAVIDTNGDGVKALMVTGKTSNKERAYVDPEDPVIVYADETSPVISCFGDARPEDVARGKKFTSGAGLLVEGEKVDVVIPVVAQATPEISIDTRGKITASVTQEAGQVAAGTKSATMQLTTQAAKTYTPGDSEQTIAPGTYLIGYQTISAVPTQTKTATANGTVTPDAGKYLSSVTVNVPEPVYNTETWVFTLENGSTVTKEVHIE